MTFKYFGMLAVVLASQLALAQTANTSRTFENAGHTGGAFETALPAPSGPVNLNAISRTGANGAPSSGTQRTLTDSNPAAQPRPPIVDAPTQFQRFVQESTGELLPVFGAALFADDAAFVPDTSLPAPADYALGAGDEVHVHLWGSVDYVGAHVVDRNGQIHLPKVGAISLKGVPARNLNAVIRSRVAQVFTNFDVTATLGSLRSLQVYVVGQARKPGLHTVPGLSSLVNAVFASGGPSANGSMRRIELKRGGRTVATLDLYDFLARGDKSADVALQPGDVIVIPPAGPRVAITGAFDHAAIYELQATGNRLNDILGLKGGVPTLASTRRALLERIDPAQTPARQVQDLALNGQGLQTTLKDGDVVTLLPISPGFGNAITLQGTVAQPLRYPFVSGMRVQDLIPERDALITPDYYRRKNLLVQATLAERDGEQGNKTKEAGRQVSQRVRNLVDDINWDYAVVERLNKDTLTTDLLPFNLRKAVVDRDPAHNLLLQPGDIVTVLSHTDVRLPQDRRGRLVRLEGEVAAPGVYQARPGETLPQLIARVGGLTPQAYVFGTELQRESVRALQQQNLSTLIRQLENQLQAQTTLPTGLDAAGLAQAKVAQEQQQAQLKAQVERLRALQSTGRLALELPAETRLTAAALPTLPLEDGDRIHIPTLPGFVAAAGAVHNENVFIHKPGKTVADILQTAGITEDAETSATFVLRADGTVVSSRGSGGWFGGNSISGLTLMPGDTVVVPAKVDRETRYNFVTRAVKDWTQIFYNFGLGVAALKAIKDL